MLPSNNLRNGAAPKELRNILVKAKVPIYTIRIIGSRRDSGSQEFGEIMLQAIADASGGKSFRPKSAEEIRLAFESIAAELKQ